MIYFMSSISNLHHVASTVKQLAADVYYFSLLYVRTSAGKLNADLKASLNGHPSMCHSIHIWIRLKKVLMETFIEDDKIILSEWQMEFILPYLVINFKINARNKLTTKPL